MKVQGNMLFYRPYAEIVSNIDLMLSAGLINLQDFIYIGYYWKE